MKKIPTKWGLMLAELHNKVMELQDTFDTFKSNCYSNDFESWELEDIKGFDLDELVEELETICDKLDDLESETSDLDYEYNYYE